MGLITQNSRIAHHRVDTPGTIFTIPASSDFTDGTWVKTDLNLGELGINMIDDRIFFRSNNGIIEIETASGLNALWKRTGEDIQAIENALTSPLIYPNILPPVTNVSDLGNPSTAWKNLYISGSMISNNGGGQLDLDNSNVAGDVFLSNDNGAGLNESIYMTGSFLSVSSYTSSNAASSIYTSGAQSSVVNLAADALVVLPSLATNYVLSIVQQGSDTNYIAVLPTLTYMDKSVVINADFTQGIRNGSIGVNSSVFGGDTLGNEASGISSFAAGDGNIASGNGSFAIGVTTTASGLISYAEGSNTIASNVYSHAEGSATTASGQASHAEGTMTTASGTYSHAEGYFSAAGGYASHSEGGSQAQADYSHSGGYAAISTHLYEWSRSSSDRAQYGIVSFAKETTNNTITEIFLDGVTSSTGGSVRFDIALKTAYKVRIYGNAVILNGGNVGSVAVFSGNGTIKNLAGTTSLLNPITMVQDEADAAIAATTMTVTADNANDSLKIEVTGITSENIGWFVRVDYEKIMTL